MIEDYELDGNDRRKTGIFVLLLAAGALGLFGWKAWESSTSKAEDDAMVASLTCRMIGDYGCDRDPHPDRGTAITLFVAGGACAFVALVVAAAGRSEPVVVQAPPAEPTSRASIADELDRLQAMFNAGHLTAEEHALARRKVLGG